MLKRNLVQSVILAAFVLLIVSCSSSDQTDGSANTTSKSQTATATTAGKGEISFKAYDLDGNLRSSDEFAGNPLIINIWGTWCPPCRMEMPGLKKIYDEYKPMGLEIVGLATERMPNNQEGVRRYVNQYGYDWVMLMADRNNKRALGLGSGVPYTVFVDKDGSVTKRHTGYMNYNQFKIEVEKIM